MKRVDPVEGETRLQFLARVLSVYMGEFSDGTLIHYDGAECDGLCLADDVETAVEMLPDLEELRKAVKFFEAVKSAPDADRAAAGNDHIDGLFKSARRLTR